MRTRGPGAGATSRPRGHRIARNNVPVTHPRLARPQWWHDAVVYQIYPRSFADAHGDGLGDIPGVTSRVDYLSALGVDAVWLSPFYPSQLADGGYDVDDYRDVDPRLGSLEDFDEMVAALHGAGIGVIVDLVPNHSSNLHAWFQAALAASPGSPERARYLFRDGADGGNEPPNDWESLFGGSAWTPVGDGQWYLHLFAPEQPDLNWDNPDVRADFEYTLRFWSDRGVDGFRIDVAHGLVKNLVEPWPSQKEIEDWPRPDGSHPLWDRDELMDIYRSWRRVFDSYDPPRFAVAEAAVHPTRRSRYASPETLGQAFNFAMQEADWRADDFHAVIDAALLDVADTGSSTTWLLGCHDSPRVASRFGLPLIPDPRVFADLEGRRAYRHDSQWLARQWLLTDGRRPEVDHDLGRRRARAAALVEFALPGCTYIYQGDELGLPEVADLPPEVLQDPMAGRSSREKGRDGCRVPLPWSAERNALGGDSFGFGTDGAHLPQPDWFGGYAVDVQQRDPASSLSMYRRALELRAEFLDTDPGEFAWAGPAADGVLHFRRGSWHCVTNFTDAPLARLAGEVLLCSAPEGTGDGVPAYATVWLRAD